MSENTETEDRPALSIIIVALNAGDDMRATLRSVAEQTAFGKDVEVVVVDGQSTDDTVEIARSFDCVNVLVSERDAGIYDAMNKGSRIAGGRWLHFLNAGDVYSTPQSLGLLLDALNRAELDGKFWFVAGARNLSTTGGPQRIKNVPHVWWRHAYGIQSHCHQATFVMRDIFHNVGGYSLDYSFVGDYDLILRLGLMQIPGMDRSIIVDYLGGGISDQRGREIPALQKFVRRRRMQLGGIGLIVDEMLAWLALSWNNFAVNAGAVRRRVWQSQGGCRLR